MYYEYTGLQLRNKFCKSGQLCEKFIIQKARQILNEFVLPRVLDMRDWKILNYHDTSKLNMSSSGELKN